MNRFKPVFNSVKKIQGWVIDYPFEKKIHNSGFVKLIDSMPRYFPGEEKPEIGCDSSIVRSARVSYGNGTTTTRKDSQLIRYLMKNYHNTPLESVVFQFHIKCPIFVERQIVKHRMTTMNQISGRYSIMKDEFYTPEYFRGQSEINKQGSNDERIDFDNTSHNEECYKLYQSLQNKGIAREMARMVLPQNLMTEFYWKIDLHNLFHFLYLRNDSHAQKETRDYAIAIQDMVKEVCPVSSKAFEDFRLNTITFNNVELERPEELSKNEKQNLKTKLEKLKNKLEKLKKQT